MTESPDDVDETVVNPRDRVVSLERGLAVLRSLGLGETMTLREVALSAGVSRAAARRSLITLIGLGYVGETPDGYEIRPRVFEFGYAYLGRQPLTAVTTKHLVDLAARINEFASVAVLDDGHIVHIVREMPRRRLIAVDINVGSRFPAFSTAQGRVLLAGLTPEQSEVHSTSVAFTRFTSHTVDTPAQLARRIDDVRRSGHAISDQEMAGGHRAVAVPIVDENGHTLAALGSIVNAASWTLKAIRTALIPELRQTSELISKDLRGAPLRGYPYRNSTAR